MGTATVYYHQGNGSSWWATTPQVPSFGATRDVLADLQTYVAATLPVLLHDPSLVITTVNVDDPTGGSLGGITFSGTPVVGAVAVATSSTTAVWKANRDTHLLDFAVGDGATDDTAAWTAACTAAAARNGILTVGTPPGGSYVVNKAPVTSPLRIVGTASINRGTSGNGNKQLAGALFRPLNSTTTMLFKVGTDGAGTLNPNNPHNLYMEGIGLLGTCPVAGGVSRTDNVTTSSSSATVTDASITAADAGAVLLGSAFPAGAVINTVNAGVSFTIAVNGVATNALTTGATTAQIVATVVPGLCGIVAFDTADVSLHRVVDLYIDTVLSGAPAGGLGVGAAIMALSSASGNGFSENMRLVECQSFGAGNALISGATILGAGGSTDGKIMGCQANSHNRGYLFGQNAVAVINSDITLQPVNNGGWAVGGETHMSSSAGLFHILYEARSGTSTAFTMRIENAYLDVINGPHIKCNSIGLQVSNVNFRGQGGSHLHAIDFSTALTTAGRCPGANIQGSDYDLNGSTTAKAFAFFGGMTAAQVAANAGGNYKNNLAYNHGAAMPGSWVAQFIGSDNTAVTNTKNATLDLDNGVTLSA